MLHRPPPLFAPPHRPLLQRLLGCHHLTALSVDFFAVFASVAAYSAMAYTFLAFGNDFFMTVHRLSAAESGRVVGSISIASAILSPLSGLALDKLGGRHAASFLCMASLTAGFALLGFTRAPYMPAVLLIAGSYAVLPSAVRARHCSTRARSNCCILCLPRAWPARAPTPLAFAPCRGPPLHSLPCRAPCSCTR